MKIIFDNNLPAALANALKRHHPSVTHVRDLGWQTLSDEEIIKRNADQFIVWVSRDGDFWRLAPPRWAFIWIARHNPKREELLGEIAHLIVQTLPVIQSGSRVLIAEDEMLHIPPP